MTQGQGEREVRCPRCGGLMKKPLGSSLYWHADSNHPRCDITNIVEASLVVQPGDEPPKEQPPHRNRQKK